MTGSGAYSCPTVVALWVDGPPFGKWRIKRRWLVRLCLGPVSAAVGPLVVMTFARLRSHHLFALEVRGAKCRQARQATG